MELEEEEMNGKVKKGEWKTCGRKRGKPVRGS